MKPFPGMKPGFLPAITVTFVLLQLLFLLNMCYIHATQFRSLTRYHNFKVLYVDYDGGVIGKSVSDAYHDLHGDGFPTVHQVAPREYPQPGQIQDAVCRGEYWGAIYAKSDGSANLTSALKSGASTPTSLAYVWNEARYPVFSQSIIYVSLLTLVQTTRSAYYSNNGSAVVAIANLSTPAILKAFTDPIQAEQINIKKTDEGARVFYNTISMAMPIIQQFFYMLALNGIGFVFDAFTILSWKTNALLRMSISILYTFIAALCMTGYIWAYRETWPQTGSHFALTWMILWLLMHINFLFFDITTAFVEIQWVPFVVLTWVIFNVASTITPFEMSPAFLRWGYALPSHEAYQVLMQIWSGGCNNRLYQALPIMFSWWILGLPTAVFAMYYRCKKAVAKVEISNREIHERDTTENQTVTEIDGSDREWQGQKNRAGALPVRQLD
ncbi:uncharacterized protein N7511_003422 [Penicillium nucicola]|uniref:uncharacterized protein n=1 Tax=Penicillium nucicola TaxID=1850975 RepID=UPI0025451D5F|nr:uncharacterized protein N7511_003422 [Penicillium nucicola]KAJ5771371.1 hypothetical protein N7511_003422 [Penicillium nucicola]